MSIFDTALVVSAVGLTIPILLAALGETVSERAGVINIGLEGMMLVGAFFGFWAAHASGSLLLGTLAGAGAGGLMAAVMAAVSVSARGNQIVVGVGINILGAGIATFANAQLFAEGGEQAHIDPMSPLAIPGLSAIPVIGKAVFDVVPLAYFAFLMVPAIWFVFSRTNLGLSIRASGENPAALSAAGVRVIAIRWAATLFAGAMAGLGGAMLTIGSIGVYNSLASGGRGFIALAAVIFGRWRPFTVLGACLVFGGTEALQLRLQAESSIPAGVWLIPVAVVAIVLAVRLLRDHGRHPPAPATLAVSGAIAGAGILLAIITPSWSIPGEFWLMLPYAVTLVVLAGIAGRTRVPSGLGLPTPEAA